MKLWTTVAFERLPHIFQNGLDNPYSEEIAFHSVPELVAEWAMANPEESAFLEVDFPDDDLDDWFGLLHGESFFGPVRGEG